MPKTLDDIRQEACYDSEEQALTKPLLTGEFCRCKEQNRCFKFHTSCCEHQNAIGRSSGKTLFIWPKCTDCGEKHPPLDDNNTKVGENNSVPKRRGKGDCHWPKPCKADCFEGHANLEIEEYEAHSTDERMDSICSDVLKRATKETKYHQI